MEVARQFSSVLLVFLLLGATLWSVRRGARSGLGLQFRKPGSRPKSLQPVERLALTPHHSLHLISVHGRELLVVTHPQGCGLLAETSMESSRQTGACGS
jgi:flagellar biogenesis protein FliO